MTLSPRTQRRMHYSHHHAASAPKPPDGSAGPDPSAASGSAPNGYGSLADHTGQQQSNSIAPSASSLQPPPTTASAMNPFVHESNDFRARFHRSLIAPSPFGGAPGAEGQQGDTGLDPHLTTKSAVAMAMDAQLGQARDEAASVAGKLDR